MLTLASFRLELEQLSGEVSWDLMKIAGEVAEEQAAPPSRFSPRAVGLGAAAMAAPLLYSAIRRPTYSKNKVIRQMQEQSQGRFTRAISTARPKSRIQRMKDKLLSGADELKYYSPNSPAQPRKVKGLVHHEDIHQAEDIVGDVNPTLDANARAAKMRKSLDDKGLEAHFFSKHAPGVMPETHDMKSVLREIGVKEMPKGRKEQAAVMQRVQDHLHKKFGKDGFLIKETKGVQSSGIFPSEKDNLAELHQNYAKLAPRVNAFHKTDGDAGSVSWDKELASLKADPNYAGRVLDGMAKNPGQALVQRKIKIQKPGAIRTALGEAIGANPISKELRVHVINGQVIPEMTFARFDPTVHVFDRQHLSGASEFAQKHIMDKMPKHMRNSSFNMDIAPLEGGGYRMIESNPGSNSGIIDVRKNPFAGAMMRKGLTGQWGKEVAGAGAAVGAGAVGAGAYGIAKAKQEPEQPAVAPAPRLRGRLAPA